MKKLNSKWKIILYGCSGMGVNMLNLIMGSYICSALLTGGFNQEDIGVWTFGKENLVIAAVWSIIVVIAKIIDGIIDVPMASFTDNLKTRWGKRRPAILIGMIPMILAYLGMLLPMNNTATMFNTVMYGVFLCIFYSFYTLTMVTYYATFSEIVDNEKNRLFLSNVKSVCDIFYFILGYALIPVFIGMKIKIKIVALIFLPFVLTMLIPLFMIKGDDNRNENTEKVKTVSLVKSIAYAFKNKTFIIWMLVYSFMTFGVQLFLGGINEFFSYHKLSMSIIMAASFAPVPFTLILYNYLTRKKGFGFSFGYTLIVFAVGMLMMFGCKFIDNGTTKLILGLASGIVCSFAVGSLFSVAYSIPSYLASKEEKETGIAHSAMYFAVQGLFAGVFTGLATGVVLVALKETGTIYLLTVVAAVACILAFILMAILPTSIKVFGKDKKDEK